MALQLIKFLCDYLGLGHGERKVQSLFTLDIREKGQLKFLVGGKEEAKEHSKKDDEKGQIFVSGVWSALDLALIST